MGAAIVEVGKLERHVESRRARRRERGVLRTVFANSLTADVEVPRQALRGLTADDLIEWIVLVVGHWDSDFDGPMILSDVSRDFGLRFPAKP